ncbi:MAG: metal-dependent hydrolase [Bacillota bacterium]
MDTITHTLFGLALYASVDKSRLEKKEKAAYLTAAVAASQIPDIDVISQLWDTQGLYQMWHRGITHSVFLTPLWALLIYMACRWIFKAKDPKLFFLSWIAVFIHDTSDLFNAWGTGYLEPFSDRRITFGTIPIVDLVFWAIILAAFLLSVRKRKKWRKHIYFRAAWVLMLLHLVSQSIQGYILYEEYSSQDSEVALSADFVPWQFTVITKNGPEVSLYKDGLFTSREKTYSLVSAEDADMDRLFQENPKAKTLYEWSPFVVIVDDDEQLGLYDPRFYINGQSFLFEAIKKKQGNKEQKRKRLDHFKERRLRTPRPVATSA